MFWWDQTSEKVGPNGWEAHGRMGGKRAESSMKAAPRKGGRQGEAGCHTVRSGWEVAEEVKRNLRESEKGG